MNVEQLIKHFNKTGVFPTDDQLLTAVSSDLNYYSIYGLEMELVEIALKDTNHPYHSKVVSDTEGEREFIKLFSNLI
jgi:hypothetical protein